MTDRGWSRCAASARSRAGALGVHALREVSLEIERGELVVVLGPSGSGKTTLLDLIGVVEPPTSGSVRVAGCEVGELDEEERTAFQRRTVGFVFQFFNLIPTLTALENVELIAELASASSTRSSASCGSVR